jgi:hypothetical protein
MSMAVPSSVFRSAMRERKTSYPFDRISAYKVRESGDNLQHECRVVASISEYLRARPCDRHSSILVGCVESDKSVRLKRIPHNIARELGYNLIPAIEALTVEGVPAAAIGTFIRSIKPEVDQLLADCEAVERATARSITPEYERMKAGSSLMERICADALDIAEQAVVFCMQHGVL